MSEELIKRLRTVARDEERAWGDEDEVVILLREAADALESSPAPVQVPEGWRIVPVEPTKAMLAAAPSAPASPSVDAEKVMALVTEYGILRYRLACIGERNRVSLAARADERKAEIRAAVAELERDAARYRHLRDADSSPLAVGRLEAWNDHGWERVDWIYDDALDAAIDAAMEAAK